MTYYVYIIKCGGDKTYYTGYTKHLVQRFMEHCSGRGAKYTRGRSPLDLVYVEEYKTQSEAMKRECQIKKLKRKSKESLIYENNTQKN